MSGVCGWLCNDGAGRANPQALATMAEKLNRFGGSAPRSISAESGAIAAAGADNDTDLFQSDDQLVAVWGHARFTDTELAELARCNGVAHALAQGYLRKGVAVLEVLSGNFAIAVLNHRRGEALLAIDRMGVRPLCYSATGTQLVFGSTLDAISAFPAISDELDRQAIYDYVHFHMVPGPRTIYTSRHRLLPGNAVLWRNGRVETQPYWEMRFTESETQPLPELKKTFLALLRTSVREASQHGAVGTFLSGGTDSSTVAGMLGEVTGQPARTYSIGFAAEGYDEMDYARIAAKHFRTRHHEYYVTPADVVAAIPQIAAAHDQPFGNSSALPTFYCAKLARDDGIDTLLGGDGGDELFGGNTRYARQSLFSLYSDLPAMLRTGFIEPVAFALPASIGIIGKAQRYIRTASQPMPARYDNYNLLKRLGAATIFTREFLDAVDQEQPIERMAETYRNAHARSLINRMLALDLKYTLADSDLPKVMRSCELAGVDVAFPLLDDAIVAFSAQLLPKLKLRRTELRYFFKQALRGFLPEEIIAKKKHGFGLPFGPWLSVHRPLQQLVGDSLQDLKRRGIVNPQFIDTLVNDLIHSHPDYYGTMAWVLMMLELWFRQHHKTA